MGRRKNFDVIIVGGGLVGSSLAIALAPLGLRVAVIEAIPVTDPAQPSFDDRSTALSNGTRRALAAMGVWDAIGSDATPIHAIHVSDRGRCGFARFNRAQEGVDALGHVVENRLLGRALTETFERLDAATLICPARVTDVAVTDENVSVTADVDGKKRTLTAPLLVAADGARSRVKEALGIETKVRDYGQTALVTNVLPSNFHDHVAYERFTDTGPLALLPTTRERVAVVWTSAPEQAADLADIDDDTFLALLQKRFGFRLGRFSRVGKRVTYPLALHEAEKTVLPRCAILGNAAHALHPVAGQGFNLGLRDAITLADVLADAVADSDADIGSGDVLGDYAAWRRRDHRSVTLFTDTLVRMFTTKALGVPTARNLGLLAFDLVPGAKRQLARQTMGLAGRLPRLARGLALTD